MAISSGVGPHFAWVTVNGSKFPVLGGSTSWEATKKTSTFSADIALGYPGVEATLGPSIGDNTATISVSTRGQQADLITGEIDTTSFDYIAGVVKITGRDASAKLHATKSAEKWVNKKPHEIISDLAGRVGLSPQVDQLAMQAGKIIQIDFSKMTDGISYAAVIHKMTEFMGAHWYVQQSKLVVKIGDPSGSGYTINYSPGPPKTSDVLRLQISRNIQAGKPIKVNVKSWHTRKAKSFTGTYTVGGNGSTQTYNYHIPGLTQDHVNQHAKSKAKDHSRHELTLTSDMVGDPAIDPTQPLNLVGTAFAQSFKIDTLSHSFGVGHTMSVTARGAKKGRS